MDVQSLKLNDYLSNEKKKTKKKVILNLVSSMKRLKMLKTKSISYIIDIREKYDFRLTVIAKCRTKKCRLNFLGESSRGQLLQN